MPRVSVYFDGFNIYFGIKDLIRKRNAPSYKWLDYFSLARKLVENRPRRAAGDQLCKAKLFTAVVSDNPCKAQDHETYLLALSLNSGLEIVRGKYQTHYPTCPVCGHRPIGCAPCNFRWRDSEEKQSDVSLGVHLVRDALRDQFDVAIVATGDSDQTPAIRIVTEECPDKTVIVAYPPERSRNADLESVCHGTMRFNNLLAVSQLPSVVLGAAGEKFERPATW